MKTNFKKTLAVFLAVLMLTSVFSVTVLAASYTLSFSSGSYGKEKDLKHSITAEKGTEITLPDAMYTRDGYVQIGWTTSRTSGGSTTSSSYLGDVGAKYTVTKKQNVYPYWKIMDFDVTFAPGANGTGSEVVVNVDYNKTTKFPGAVFTREDYVMIGWSTVDGGELEYELTATTPKITETVTFYPVWQKCDYSVETNISTADFGTFCEGYTVPESETLVITNVGNMTLTYTLPSNSYYECSVKSGSLTLEPGKSVEIEIVPAANLDVADYADTLVFDCDYDVSDITVAVKFAVIEHIFGKYVSNGDASYSQNGTKTAACINDCGAFDTIIDEGSQKEYDAKYNTVFGLAKEYIYHRTVNFEAFGSGYDDEECVIGKRFVPDTWYVNEEFNGEFEDGDFTATYTHTVFGDYTLSVTYYEEELVENAETGEYEWVATGVTDEKVFEYSVGANAHEEQEIIRPNTILSIIFGLFAQLLALLGLGG